MTVKQRLIEARDKIKAAEDMKCTCTSFTLQYEGCCCLKAKMIKEAKRKLQMALDDI